MVVFGLPEVQFFIGGQGADHHIPAMFAAKIIATGQKIEVAHASFARFAVDNEWANEPIPIFLLVTARNAKGNGVIKRGAGDGASFEDFVSKSEFEGLV